jgi:hypothetical protein
MSKKTSNQGRQGARSPTSRQENPGSAQPAGGELRQGLVTRKVGASRPNLAEDSRPSQEQIAVLAYHLWESGGRRAGTDRDDWFQAERLLRGDH